MTSKLSTGFSPITSTQTRIHVITSGASNVREIDPQAAANDDDLLAEIG